MSAQAGHKLLCIRKHFRRLGCWDAIPASQTGRLLLKLVLSCPIGRSAQRVVNAHELLGGIAAYFAGCPHYWLRSRGHVRVPRRRVPPSP